MNRILVLEGYRNPFGDSHRRINTQSLGGTTMRRRRSTRSVKKQQSKMKSCAASWKRSSKRGSYRVFMRSCLKK